MYKKIQKYNSKTDEWSYEEFETKEDFVKFVQSKFIAPGDHKLHSTKNWRKTAKFFEDNGYYSSAVRGTSDYKEFWDTEKDRCRNGVIIDEFYLTRHYYFYLNFLKINNKETKQQSFPDIYDAQYYIFLYFLRCELEYKYSVVLKKRQFGSTYLHLAVLLNEIWFEKSVVNKLGASDEKYIESDWEILDEYKNFLNKYTAWQRPFNPGKKFNWQQRILVKQGDKQFYKGNGSILKALNLKTNPTKQVGGLTTKFYYEEAGITKTMGKTFQYIDPALKYGAITTGMFMAAGSVGELDQCDDLKRMTLYPESANVLSVDNIFTTDTEYKKIAFFVPEYWSMVPFIDKEGNSLIEEAKEWCINERARLKETSSAEDYRLYVSQHPFNVEEAFAYRKDSLFPQAKILKQQERIKMNSNKPVTYELEYDASGKIKAKPSDNVAISKFPLGERDSTLGAIEVFEPPVENAPNFTYFAGVDSIQVDKTTSSASLFSIYIFKNLTETISKEGKLKVDGYKMVACYTGRHDDVNKVNEIAEKLIVWYNALAAIEANVPSFINHMQKKGLQRYMATKNEMSFISELKTNQAVYSTWGFKMNTTIKTYFIDIINEYLNEELDIIRIKNSDKIVKIVYGIERIPDYMILEELRQYHDKLNVDRFVAFGAGLALMKSFRKYNIGVSKVDEGKEEKEEIIQQINRSYFSDRLINKTEVVNEKRSYFKNYN